MQASGGGGIWCVEGELAGSNGLRSSRFRGPDDDGACRPWLTCGDEGGRLRGESGLLVAGARSGWMHHVTRWPGRASPSVTARLRAAQLLGVSTRRVSGCPSGCRRFRYPRWQVPGRAGRGLPRWGPGTAPASVRFGALARKAREGGCISSVRVNGAARDLRPGRGHCRAPGRLERGRRGLHSCRARQHAAGACSRPLKIPGRRGTPVRHRSDEALGCTRGGLDC